MASYNTENYAILILNSICTVIIGSAAISTTDNVEVIQFNTLLLMYAYIKNNNLIINNSNELEDTEWQLQL